jgi:predicted deacylase
MLKSDLKHSNSEHIERVRWKKSGDKTGPVLVLFVGIHGNEPAGLKAIDRIADIIDEKGAEFGGTVYAITGNIRALELGIRYLDTDLNRLWEVFYTDKDFSLKKNGKQQPSEYGESLEIKRTVDQIIKKHIDQPGDLIFADLHTTSSQSCAFILLNDTLANRKLSRKFPVPHILGIEENIEGTLLSYINNLGYKAIGFEAGAHLDDVSVERSEAFLWLLFHNTGILEISDLKLRKVRKTLEALPGVPDSYYQVKYHKLVDDPEKFEMISGFENFDFVKKDTPLAYEHGELIRAPISGRIFMPLYQNVGHDGFMIIREVSEFWLELSAILRKSPFNGLLKFLPGVKKINSRSYEIDLRIARFLVRDIFHLMGYRVTEKDENTLICYRR